MACCFGSLSSKVLCRLDQLHSRSHVYKKMSICESTGVTSLIFSTEILACSQRGAQPWQAHRFRAFTDQKTTSRAFERLSYNKAISDTEKKPAKRKLLKLYVSWTKMWVHGKVMKNARCQCCDWLTE
jgi:hypothetical protein